MSKFTSIFKKFDKIIFKQVDTYKSSSFYLQSLDQFNTLDENVQKIIKQTTSFLVSPAYLVVAFILSIEILKESQRQRHFKNLYNT